MCATSECDCARYAVGRCLHARNAVGRTLNTAACAHCEQVLGPTTSVAYGCSYAYLSGEHTEDC